MKIIGKKQLILFTVSITLAVFLFLFWLKPTWNTDKASAIKSEAAASKVASLKGKDGDIVSAIESKTAAISSGSKFRYASPFDTALRRKYIHSPDLAALFTELEHKSDPDSLFFRAVILQYCQGYTRTYAGESLETLNQRIEANFKGNYLEQRRALLAKSKSRNVIERCKSFPTTITAGDIVNAQKLATDAGDTRGQLAEVFSAIVNNGVKVTSAELAGLFPEEALKNSPMPVVPNSPTSAQLELIKSALATRDPSQILLAGPLLTAMYSEYTLEFGGSNGKAIRHDDQLWTSVACHFGEGCDINNPRVDGACILSGWCDVGSYDQMLQRYVIPPEKWDQFQKDRHTLITAIENKDWSLLREVRGPMNNASGTYLRMLPPRYNFKF